MRFYFLSIAAAFDVSGCAPPPPPSQPAPTQITSALAPVDVVRRATASLIGLGFEVTVSDATGGLVQAKRVRSGTVTGPVTAIRNDPPPDIVCRKWGYAESLHTTTYFVAVNAVSQGAGSAITVTSRINSEWPGVEPILRPAPNEVDCVPDGSIERRVVEAILAK